MLAEHDASNQLRIYQATQFKDSVWRKINSANSRDEESQAWAILFEKFYKGKGVLPPAPYYLWWQEKFKEYRGEYGVSIASNLRRVVGQKSEKPFLCPLFANIDSKTTLEQSEIEHKIDNAVMEEAKNSAMDIILENLSADFPLLRYSRGLFEKLNLQSIYKFYPEDGILNVNLPTKLPFVDLEYTYLESEIPDLHQLPFLNLMIYPITS